MKKILLNLILLIIFSTNAFSSSFTIEAESMTLSGKYAGKISSPFSGIALYANGDQGSIINNFQDGNGHYTVSISGASNNSNSAGVSLYINGTKIKAFSFTGTTVSIQSADVKITGLSSSSNTITLLLETDNGSSDTYIDKITFTFQTAIVDKDSPVLPAQGAYYTGQYRNMLKEYGYPDSLINKKLDYLWNRYFYGDPSTEAVYYPVGEDEAYILDTGNDDIRTEGMSYGMMICVQMNKQAEFNRLWKFVKTRLQFTSGVKKGYFAWQISKDFATVSTQTAPDGDEYFAMALMFASGRWGDGEGIYNYWNEANYILRNSMSKGFYINSSTTNLFDERQKQVVFVPYASSAKHTDPSYHVPAFYQLWSMWADSLRWFWSGLANKSREMFPKFANAKTGLMPDYANFDGTATGGDHANFLFDAWRCAMNMGVDYAWFKASEDEVMLVNRLHNFFASKGVNSYLNQYTLSGTELSGGDHSPGLVACNATGALASNQAIAWDFIEDFFTASLTSGKYRYYDGLLYFLNYLHLSGNFKIYKPAKVLETPLDERYTYTDGYLVMDDFESRSIGEEYFMYMTESSTAKALVAANPTNSTEKSLQILPGNYDEFFAMQYKLPNEKTLKDYTNFEFDVYYSPSGDNKNQYLKVNFDTIPGTPFFQINTGDNTNLGKWIHISVPLSGVVSGNVFKLYIGIRTRSANFYIDNLKLKTSYNVTAVPDQTVANDDVFYCINNMLYLKNNIIGNINVYDINGRLLISKKNISNLNLSLLKTNVYILEIQTMNGKVATKLIKNN